MSAEAVHALYDAKRVERVRACDIAQGDLLTHDDSEDGTVRVLAVVGTPIGVQLVFSTGDAFDYGDEHVLARVTS